MTTIKKSILATLLAHANPWGTRPDSYGATVEGYAASARVASAGTTWADLHAAGVSLQSDTHDRYVAALKKHPDAEKDMANRRYRLAHGGTLVPDTRVNPGYRNPDGQYAVGAAGVDARVNPETCPSGLRPRIIKAHHKSDSLRAWHAALVQAVANTPDGGQVQVPDLDNLAGIPSVSTGERTPRVPGVSGPTGYRAFVSLRDALAVTISNLIQNLRGAEDTSVTGPAADAFASWAFTAPTDTLSGVKPDHYDRDIIREGSVVVLIPGAKAAPALGFMAKLSKVDVPETLTVARIDGAVCYLTAQGFKKDLPVPTAEVRRYTPPAPVVAAAWKPSVGALASLGGIVVLVNSLSETEAQVTDEEGNDASVSLADLTAPE